MANPSVPNGLYSNPEVDSAVDEDLWGTILNNNFNIIDAGYTTRTNNLSFDNFELSEALVVDLSEKFLDKGDLSGAIVVDYLDGHYQRIRLTGNATSLTINNFPSSGQVGFLTLEFIQDGTGSRTLDLTGGTYRAPAGAIELTADPNAIDKLRLESRDSGVTIDVFINNNLKVII